MNLPHRSFGSARCWFWREAGFASAKVIGAVLILLLTGCLVGVAVSGKQKGAELAQLHAQHHEQLAKLEEENQEVQRLRNQLQELDRYRKEAEEVHRLRSEIRQLRQDKEQSEKIQAEARQLRDRVQQLQKVQAENQQLRVQAAQIQVQQQAQPAADQPETEDPLVMAGKCRQNMEQIVRAILQWGQANSKARGSAVHEEDILPYLPDGTMPVCPAGGTYTLGSYGGVPSCNVEGHSL